MKTFLRISGAGIFLMLPAISGASTLPTSFFYRSYDCRVGSVPVTITNKVVVPPSGNDGNTDNNPNLTPPPPPPPPPPDPTITTIIPPTDGNCTTPCVPAPASSEMAGAGLALLTAYSWMRGRKAARA